jgi:prepilin peptidase CpaA
MELLPILILPLLLVIAAVSDMTTLTIPNWISGLLILSFLVLGLAWGMPMKDIALSAGTGFVVLLIGMGLFALGWLGGGDAKLLAATAVWFGWPAVLSFLVFTVIAGGGVSLVLLGFRCIPMSDQMLGVPWVGRLHRIGEALPYGIAIALGGLAALSQVPVLSLLAG